MKRLIYILAALILAAGCEKEGEDITLSQIQRIESFLTSSHSPRLIAYDKLDEYMDDSTLPQFYETFGRTAFRYIVNYYDEERLSRPEILRGQTISITCTVYNFTSYRAPGIKELVFTNDPSMEELMAEAGWTMENNPFFTFEPLRVTVGSGGMVSGVDAALRGCRAGDEVEIYCTSSEAYGDKLIESLPKNTPLYWHIVINGME